MSTMADMWCEMSVFRPDLCMQDKVASREGFHRCRLPQYRSVVALTGIINTFVVNARSAVCDISTGKSLFVSAS